MSVFFDLKEKLNMYFGVGSIGILFVCALLFWCIKKEKSSRLRFYIYYILIAFVGMMNPISLLFLDKTGNMGVYERFFWLLMTTFLVAFTFAVFVHKKRVLLIPLLILLLMSGKSVFTDIEYKPAENLEKINQEAIEVSDIIMRDFENLPQDAEIKPNRGGVDLPRAVVTDPLCESIRMYNANIELWFVRKYFGNYNKKNYSELAQLMTEENIEIPIDIVVKNMEKQNFTYFVVGNWQRLTGDMSAYDIEMIGQTENYCVYKYMEEQVFTMIQYADVQDYQCMSYLIYNSRGGLVIVDGGRAWQSEMLVDEIKKRGGVVDAWIITHPHDDHAGVLASVLAAEWDKSEITIKEVLMGEMDYEAVMAEGLDRTDMYGYLNMGLERFGNVRVLRAGEELDVIGLHMKVLHTCNDTVIKNSKNIMNDGSMVFKLSGGEKSVLFLSDTADNNELTAQQVTDYAQGSEIGRMIADEIMTEYPEDIKCEIVQMSHHGNGSYPDYFYEAIAPEIAFFDAPEWLMNNKNKETGEESYYSTPHYVKLMKRLGAKIYYYGSKIHYIRFS